MLTQLCDKYYIDVNANKFYRECFTLLPKENMITQIGKQLFFTTVNVMDLYINHHGLEYSIRIREPSKIIETIDYKINTSYFFFNPNDNGKYKIFLSNTTDKSIHYTFNLEKYNSNDIILLSTIQFIILSIITSTIRLCCTFISKGTNDHQLNDNDKYY